MAKSSRTRENTGARKGELPFCGIVRPIADFDPYPGGHWSEVHEILRDAAEEAGFQARLVSENDSAGVILGDIVSNLYSDPIVICDVSGRNANVMFELGMRVAFEKPLLIVTDDLTPFSFDISIIKHIVYPHSLRFKEIMRFKREVSAAIKATVAQSTDRNYRGYLQQFGPIQVAELGTQVVSVEQILEDLQDIKRFVRNIESREASRPTKSANDRMSHYIRVGSLSQEIREELASELLKLGVVESVQQIIVGEEPHLQLKPDVSGGYNYVHVVKAAAEVRGRYGV